MSHDFLQNFNDVRELLAARLLKRVEEYNKWTEFHFDADLLQDLADFSTRGKMLRGVGFILLVESFGYKNRDVAVEIAIALELFQSSLLIHDDVMDRDEKRRGKASIFKLYSEKAQNLQLREADQFGIGAAICLGDIAFFLGYDILNKLEIDPKIKQAILGVTNQELIQLGMSQLQDSYLASQTQPVTEAEILQMYVGKTARYTWRWPLLLAAVTTEQPIEVQNNLVKLADTAGLLFQLKDDELGLFGDEQHTGKKVGSDIKEGKKTLYWLHLSEKTKDNKNVAAVLAHFGNQSVTSEQIQEVQESMTQSGIRAEVQQKMELLYGQSKEIIKTHFTAQSSQILTMLLDLSYKRQK